MNNLMSRKKKYRFQVELRVEELQHVPFLCQELYVKVRLLNGGFTNHSQSLMVENHAVRWDETFKFCSKMTANASTGELDSCICRVSVRQEMRGGRSFQKLGFADVNLSQFAGSGGSHIYLLEGYDSKHRQINSTLKVTVDMTLLSGDPCFKAQPWPRPSQPQTVEGPAAEDTAAAAAAAAAASSSTHQSRPASGSVASLPSLGYNSLDKKAKAGGGEEQQQHEGQLIEQTGHSRNSSNTSGSGSGSQGSGGTYSEGGSLERTAINSGRSKSAIPSDNNKDPRVVSTREDAHDMIDQIFQDNIGIIRPDDSAESSGLQLYIREDGTASVSGHAMRSNGELKPIIINNR